MMLKQKNAVPIRIYRLLYAARRTSFLPPRVFPAFAARKKLLIAKRSRDLHHQRRRSFGEFPKSRARTRPAVANIVRDPLGEKKSASQRKREREAKSRWPDASESGIKLFFSETDVQSTIQYVYCISVECLCAHS